MTGLSHQHAREGGGGGGAQLRDVDDQGKLHDVVDAVALRVQGCARSWATAQWLWEHA